MSQEQNSKAVDEVEGDDSPKAQADEGEDKEEGSSAVPKKRGRGRPKGSKNKKPGESTAPKTSSETGGKRKRGRPRKHTQESVSEPPPKKRRGRPPKQKVTEEDHADIAGDDDEAEAGAEDLSEKRGPGRPKKGPE